MKIWVSSLADVHVAAKKAGPTHAVSLLSPGDAFPEIDGLESDAHHRVHMHDIREELPNHVTPSGDHVRGLIDFLSGWRPERPILIHCWAGISRSTASAFIAACLHNPDADEKEIVRHIRLASPTAFPNTRIVSIADDMMGRRGRMSDAVQSLSEPDFAYEAAPFHIPARFEAARKRPTMRS